MAVVVRKAVAADLGVIFTLATQFSTSFQPERVAVCQ